MTDQERAEARAIVMWRVLLAAYRAWPRRIEYTPEEALGRAAPVRTGTFSIRDFGLTRDSEESFAFELISRMLDENLIAGTAKQDVLFEIMISPLSRPPFQQPLAGHGKWLCKVVEDALNGIAEGRTQPLGTFLAWARQLGFEP